MAMSGRADKIVNGTNAHPHNFGQARNGDMTDLDYFYPLGRPSHSCSRTM